MKDPYLQKEINDGLLKTAAHTLEQNRRLIEMIEEQVVQLDKIKIIIRDVDDPIRDKIHKVLYP